MKTWICLITMLLCAARLPVQADPNRYEWRSFGDVHVDMNPLFIWWNFVSHATNDQIDLTDVDSNKLDQVSNLWQHLPARPLLEWNRVLAAETNIIVVGTLWKVTAAIEPAPMMVRTQTIFLENPPTREIQEFKKAINNYAKLSGDQEMDIAYEELLKSNIQAEAMGLLSTNAAAATTVPYPASVASVRTYQHDALVTTTNLNDTQARTLNRKAQLGSLQQFIATFPSTNMYWLDHFARQTGRKIDGIDVYNLGTADSLTY